MNEIITNSLFESVTTQKFIAQPSNVERIEPRLWLKV